MEVSEEDTEILRQRGVAFNNQGDIFLAQGNLQSALQAYQNGLAIAQKLAAADPSNTTWQRDLSVSFEKVGNVFQDQGQLAEALKAYQDGLAIAQKLAAADPSNTTWQIDLVVSFWKTSSSIHVTTEFDKQGAQDKLNRALDILRRLDEQGRLAPRYQQWIGTIEKRLESLSTPGDRR
jgi:tetratricopeptide (TPR) repeat protein